LGLGAFFGSFLPLSLLPMSISVPQQACLMPPPAVGLIAFGTPALEGRSGDTGSTPR
jgi:hypothetical protein